MRASYRMPDPELPGGDAPGPINDPALSSGRASSVTFRTTAEVADTAAMLDPANQSLAEALRVLLKIIYAGVAVMAAYYLFSGTKNVQEGERGVRLLFGRIQRSNLEPGLHWAPPFPFGEIKTVGSGVKTLDIKREFWPVNPNAGGGEKENPLEGLAPSPSLKPDQDGSGSIITGDGALAHARFNAQYRVTDPAAYLGAIRDGESNESNIVKQAVKRGVVMACAQISIDDLLRQGEERGESLSTRIKSFAQEALDTGGTGISVERVSITIQTPPISTREAFSKVQASVSDAQKFIENARKDATKALNDAAGAASGPIIERINAYELAIDQNDRALQERTLAEIESMLRGPSFEHEGRVVQVSGAAAKIISDAELYRTRAVSKARGDAARFRAKLEQFGRNPLVVTENEWAAARQVFLDRPTTTQMLLPPSAAGDLLVLRLNRDPAWLRDMEKRVKQDEMRRAEREQMEQLRREGLKTEVKNESQTQ